MSEPKAAELPGKRCREMYSGSKFFWRHKETIEINIFHHLAHNCVEICSYNNRSGTEFDRLYLSLEGIYANIGEESIAASIAERKASEKAEDLVLSDLAVEDEERRLAVSSYLISRLDYATSTPTDPSKKTITFLYSKSLSNPRTNLVTPLLESKPHDISPVLIARRRLSSAEEIESVLQNMASIEATLHHSTSAAESIVDKMIDSNSKLLGSRPNSKPSSRPTSPSSAANQVPLTHAEQMLTQPCQEN